MREKFPIYHIDFTLYAGENELASCEQDMMTVEEFIDHDAALLSLYRIVTSLAKELGVTDTVTSWVGSIALVRHDSWCYHWHSHYTYQYFSSEADALADFLCWAKEQPGDWAGLDCQMCYCETCKSLRRTMILHSGESTCG